MRLDGVSSSPPCNVGRYVRGYGRDSDHRVDNPLLFRCARKGKTTKNDRKKEVSDRSRYFFRYRTANASTGPHQRSTRLRRRNAQFNRRPLTYLTTNTKDRRRSGGPALSSVLNETEKGECAIQPSSPDLSRCEYGDRRRSGGPALSYSVSQENLGSYSYSRPQRR